MGLFCRKLRHKRRFADVWSDADDLDVELAVNDVADAEEYSWEEFIDEIAVR